VRHLGRDVLLVDDTYNANPASVRTALAGLAEIGRVESRRTVAILGEMRELGAVAEAEHTAMGDAIVSAGVSLVIGSGGLVDLTLARAAIGGVATIRGTSSADAARHAVTAIRPRDVVLVKGSRGVALERVVEEIVRAVGAAGEPH
jgi:UDP-N-acetylmuramoyl-tripeptide--D-alanyl-D-alanine ligase